MYLFQLLSLDNLHLYDSNVPIELEYLILDKSTKNAHPKKLSVGIFFLEDTMSRSLFSYHSSFINISHVSCITY